VFVLYFFVDFEKKVIQASAIVQQETNVPITFHPGRNNKSPFEIMRVFTEAGGKSEDVIMSHLDSRLIVYLLHKLNNNIYEFLFRNHIR